MTENNSDNLKEMFGLSEADKEKKKKDTQWLQEEPVLTQPISAPTQSIQSPTILPDVPHSFDGMIEKILEQQRIDNEKRQREREDQFFRNLYNLLNNAAVSSFQNTPQQSQSQQQIIPAPVVETEEEKEQRIINAYEDYQKKQKQKPASNGSKQRLHINWDKRKVAAILILIIGVATLVGAVAGTLNVSFRLPGTGGIAAVNLGIFGDAACTIPASSVDWGTLMPGYNTTRTIYVKNTGSTNETLSMVYGGWNPPEAGNYLTLTWNREGIVVPPGVSGPAIFTLSCPSNIPSSIMNFNVNITITGVMP